MHANWRMQKEKFVAHNIAGALQSARKLTNTTQEAFDQISSRTYISAIERGLKTPTLSKIDEVAGVMGLLPLTVLVMAYAGDDMVEQEKLLDSIRAQLQALSNKNL